MDGSKPEVQNTENVDTDLLQPAATQNQFSAMTQKQFDQHFERIEEKQESLLSRVKKSARRKCTFSKSGFLRALEDTFPCIRLIRTYRLRNCLLGDIVAGLSLTVLVVPQSMGYAVLASVPPIVGLYTSFFPALIYFVFGTCQHLSVGTMAFCSLAIRSIVQREISLVEDSTRDSEVFNSTSSPDSAVLEDRQMSIAVSVTLLSGLILTVMSVLKLGFVVSYMGDAFTSGYLAGGNICVQTTQVILMLQIPVGGHSRSLSYIYTVIDMICGFTQLNVAALLISIITVPLLVVVKYCINARFKSKLKVPVPIEIIIVLLATLASHYGRFEHNYGVRIVKNTPKGVPRPVVPNVDTFPSYFVDAISLALVSYAMMYIMAKLFSERHDYTIRPNQELLATGLCSVIGSFFSCISPSTSPPRCFLMESTGGHTQVAFLVAALGTLIALLFLAPLLQSLPICVLACLIFVASIPLFEQYRVCVYYWKTNKYDFVTWFVSACAAILFGVGIGLFIGLAFSLFMVILRSQHVYTSTVGLINARRGEFADLKQYSAVRSLGSVVIFRFAAPLYFATSDIFKKRLFSAVGNPRSFNYVLQERRRQENEFLRDVDPMQCVTDIQRLPESSDWHVENLANCSTGANDIARIADTLYYKNTGISRDDVIDTIIIDCSAITFIDTSGANLLGSLYLEYELYGVRFALASCTETTKAQLSRVCQCEKLRTKALYPTLRDALCVLTSKNCSYL